MGNPIPDQSAVGVSGRFVEGGRILTDGVEVVRGLSGVLPTQPTPLTNGGVRYVVWCYGGALEGGCISAALGYMRRWLTPPLALTLTATRSPRVESADSATSALS